MPKKKPPTPVIKIKERFFWGEILPISKAPIRAPKPSEEAKIPISTSDNISFSRPKTGINETKGKPKMLKMRVITRTNLKLTKLYAFLPVFKI